MARCTNVECPSPEVYWSHAVYRDGAWMHRATQDRSCHIPNKMLGGVDLVTPPLAQQHPRLPGQLFWHCTTCGTWAAVRSVPDGGTGYYAHCFGPASDRHEQVSWASEGREIEPEPVDTTPPAPEPRTAPDDGDQVVWEYGIEYHYSPGRWHVLPNLVIADQAAAERELAKRRVGFGEGGTKAYRLLKRRAPGPWTSVGE